MQLVGFVFQNFQLIPTLTALENVTVPLELRGDRSARQLALELIERVGLGRTAGPLSRATFRRRTTAGRARAGVYQPPENSFADEPTGNLDAETSAKVIEVMLELNRTAGTALALVTHDPEIARLTERTIRLRNGAMVE